MHIKEIQNQILTSDEFVLSETAKIQTLYALKREIRYAHSRNEEITTESVAEHVYGINILIKYFLPLENPDGSWDKEKINTLALLHDIDEIETGDVVGYKKTTSQFTYERTAQGNVITQLPKLLQESFLKYLDEYEKQETAESQFLKAVDKTEPNFHLLCENGKKIQHEFKTTCEEHHSIKRPHVTNFPYLSRFHEVITNKMVKDGFFLEIT